MKLVENFAPWMKKVFFEVISTALFGLVCIWQDFGDRDKGGCRVWSGIRLGSGLALGSINKGDIY